MRLLILVAGSSLILTACGNKGQADNTLNVDENLAAENITSNDVTAIDAVTGDAANMAADVNYTEVDNLSGNDAAPATSRPTRRPVGTSTSSPADNAVDPATNSAANATE